jgi:putative MATE family efflux protein
MTEDNMLGTQNIKSLMFKLAVPAVVAQLINMLYNIVDRVYIGHLPEVGATALTGVGLCFPVIMLVTAFANLAGAGGAPRAAIELGRGNKENAEKILGNCFTILLCFAVVLTIVFNIGTVPLLRAFGASDSTLPFAADYMHIYVSGSLFIMIVMGLNPFITTQGFANFSMLTTVIGAVINIILDPIFIFALDLGVAGAALASVISQAISAIWVFLFFKGRKTLLNITFVNMRLVGKIILPCLALGMSTFVMVSTESLLSICFNSSLSKYGGDLAVGALTIISSIAQLINLPLHGICQGGQPIISYNYGAGNHRRVREAFRLEFLICVISTCTFFIIVMLFPRALIRIFGNNSELIDYTVWTCRIYMAGIFAMGVQVSCQQTFVALGQAKVSLLLACLRKLILLIPLIYILPLFFANKVLAVFLAEPISDIIAATITGTVFYIKLHKLLESEK